MNTSITASIVLYNSAFDEIQRVINDLFKNGHCLKLYLIDNSPTDVLKTLAGTNLKIEYIHCPQNPGFGAAHNIAITKAINLGMKYHFVINPDIFFEEDVISPMIEYMESDIGIGMMMPQILNPDGTEQHLPKLLPSPLSILWRKIKKPALAYNNFINKYELRQAPKGMIYNTPILSGCFTLLNLNSIKEIGVYDDKYFMYFEDWDLSRRMHAKYKTIYFPGVSVYHRYDSGANRSLKLFKIFLCSAITYFNKWGWFFDSTRNSINKNALSQFNEFS